jgi:signal transduction histidine kinase
MELSPTVHRNLSLLAQQWVGNVLLLGSFLFLFIGLLDYVITPENFRTFMIVRVIMSCVLLFLYALNKLKTDIWYQYAIMLTTGVLCAIAIEFMILMLGGPRSTYYAGFIIIITCCLGFVPLSLGQAAVLAGAVYAIYLIPITSLPALRDPIFINNNVFLFSICIITLALRWQSQKRIVNELVLQEELQRTGQQLQHYAEEMQIQNDEMKSFTSLVSHDLRAPLVNIKGFSDELSRSIQEIAPPLARLLAASDVSDRAHLSDIIKNDIPQALGFIESSVKRMDSLISAILQLSRIGRRELKPETIDMQALVDSLLKTLAHQLETKRVTVSVKELPAVVADRTAMGQIIGNLLDNAVKYLEPGRDGLLEIRGERTPVDTVITVSDNGRGMVPQDIPRIFELFRRVGKQDVPGEGMGLAYVKTLIRSHGGRIWCDSELGKGTTFSFKIPHVRENILEKS